MKNKLITVFLVFAYLFPNSLKAQISRAEIISAYIYSFAKQTTWPNEKEFQKFTIYLITDNDELIETFRDISKSKRINKMPISLITEKRPNEKILGAQLIFIDESKSEFFLKTFYLIEKKPIMLISENYKNKRLVMLNIYDGENNKLLFEINKANIYKQGLKTDDLILLYGGTEIDVAKLYLESQQTLIEMDKKLAKTQELLNSLDTLIHKKNEEVANQKEFIKNQNQKIGDYLTEKEKLVAELQGLKSSMQTQKKILDNQRKTMASLNIKLNRSKLSLEGQNKEIEVRIEILDKLKSEIVEMNKAIEMKDKALITSEETISRQKETVYLFGAIVFLVIILVIGMFIANRSNKKKNILLSMQKEDLNLSFDEIIKINLELNEKNDELSIALDKLKYAQQLLVQSEKMASLGVLTAGIAHEINNPINFIYTGINSLNKDFEDLQVILNEVKKLNPDDEKLSDKLKAVIDLKKEYYFDEACAAIPQTIEDISTGVERTVEIISGLKSFSRMGDDSIHPFYIQHAIDNALLILKNQYKNRISLTFNYDPDLPEINGNQGKLLQAFMNMIGNSIDAIEENGSIEINASYDELFIKVSIKDSGKGMDEQTRDKIFDPFFTTKEVGKGTGLGMAITYGIIQEHKGQIDILTEPGKERSLLLVFH